jgi:hypothetical protein
LRGVDQRRRLAVFVSPHGFGHAARTAAILAALAARVPDFEPVLFTTVPRWFFEESLPQPWQLFDVACDVGLVQRDPLHEDPAATARQLAALIAELPLTDLADQIRELDCAAVVADIAPLGLAVAAAAGLPSILIESFTWDWIYRDYLAAEPALGPLAEQLAALFATATHRLQLTPCCAPFPGARTIPPVARACRRDSEAVRQSLAVPPGQPLVVVSMGGIPSRIGRHADGTLAPGWRVAAEVDATIAVLGASDHPLGERWGNLRLLPHRLDAIPGGLYHVDLVGAAEVLVGKLGYSTVAEAWHAGARYLYLRRPAFRESPVLERFVQEALPSAAIAPGDLASGAWLEQLSAMLANPRAQTRPALGAAVAAANVAEICGW